MTVAVFSTSNESLRESANKLRTAGMKAQMRDARVFTDISPLDGQFDTVILVRPKGRMTKAEKEHTEKLLQRVKNRYEGLKRKGAPPVKVYDSPEEYFKELSKIINEAPSLEISDEAVDMVTDD